MFSLFAQYWLTPRRVSNIIQRSKLLLWTSKSPDQELHITIHIFTYLQTVHVTVSVYLFTCIVSSCIVIRCICLVKFSWLVCLYRSLVQVHCVFLLCPVLCHFVIHFTCKSSTLYPITLFNTTCIIVRTAMSQNINILSIEPFKQTHRY